MKTDPQVNYTRLEVHCPSEFTDILIAELAEAGFDMFMENDGGFEADAEVSHVDAGRVAAIREKYSHVSSLTFETSRVKKENWNEQWEKSIAPVILEDQVIIRAEFHKPEREYPYEIIITPKMSFGTGHHPTTCLMLKSQLRIDHRGKVVMDAGCGTAILSIMASKLGASLVESFDIDEWSMLNGEENVRLNRCGNIHIQRGTIRDFSWVQPFDIILANINRNILLDEMPCYANALAPGGVLLLSGFYEADVRDLVRSGAKAGLIQGGQDKQEQWSALRLAKPR